MVYKDFLNNKFLVFNILYNLSVISVVQKTTPGERDSSKAQQAIKTKDSIAFIRLL